MLHVACRYRRNGHLHSLYVTILCGSPERGQYVFISVYMLLEPSNESFYISGWYHLFSSSHDSLDMKFEILVASKCSKLKPFLGPIRVPWA